MNQKVEVEGEEETMPDDYKIGYKKPPTHSQFQKGKSGNPGGRPKGKINFKTDLAEELAEKIRVREGDKTITVSKQRALVKRLMNGVLQGNPRMTAILINVIHRYMGSEELMSADEALNEDERQAFDFLVERIRNAQAQNHDPNN